MTCLKTLKETKVARLEHETVFPEENGEYVGEHEGGMKSGFGEMKWASGAVYKGYW